MFAFGFGFATQMEMIGLAAPMVAFGLGIANKMGSIGSGEPRFVPS